MRQADHMVGLDAIRFLAAISVMVFHLCFWIWAGVESHSEFQISSVSYTYLAPYTEFGWVGVEIFFVISGVVIAFSAERSTPLSFLRGRFLRLFPAAVICASVTALALLAYGNAFTPLAVLKSWLKSVLFYPIDGWIDGSYWTLGLEVVFYGIVLAVLLIGSFRRLEKAVGTLGWLSALFWVGFAAAAMMQQSDAAALTLRIGNALHQRLVLLSLLPHGCLFALGVVLYFTKSSGLTVGRGISIVAFAVGSALETAHSAREYSIATHLDLPASPPVALFFCALALILLSLHPRVRLQGRWGRAASALRQLGLLTYPIYLLHQNAGYIVIGYLREAIPDGAALAIALAACLALAFLVTRYLEPALRDLLRRQFDRWALLFVRQPPTSRVGPV